MKKPAAGADGKIPAYDIFEGAKIGAAYPDPPSDCTPGARAYTNLTIIPKKAVENKKLKIDMKNIPFADKSVINLIPPAIPAQIEKPILAKTITPVGGRYFSGKDEGGTL